MGEKLKLRAESLDDLAVMSACLQDALTCVSDMAFVADENRFVVMFSRFMWEAVDSDPEVEGLRIRAGLHFEAVQGVATQGVDQKHRLGLIPLLALTGEAEGNGVEVTLEFGGRGRLRVRADRLEAMMTDTGNSWPTPNRPDHKLDQDA